MRWIFRFFKLILILVIAYGIGRFTVVYIDSLVVGERAPYFQQQSDHSIVVRWTTERHSLGVVRYGEDPAYLEFLAIEASPEKDHSVKLTGLKPDTRYYYKVGDIDGFIETDLSLHWFTTSPVPGSKKATRIWAIGDSGEPGEVATQVRDAMYQWVSQHPREGRAPVDVWLALGDNAYRSGSNDQFQAALFDAYPRLLRNTVLWPVYGNHDARRWTYFRIFDLPEQAEAGGVASDTEHYYSFDYADVHFIVLDSQDGDTAADSEMLDWLRRDLAENRRNWVIAAFHHPPYTKGSHDSDDVTDSGG
ncbi:MAG TPA: metallophosphoesterase family protein, partial [Thiotrichales bacterium]|nr:metallophosphoesterase family protein [Thiotrichales bacterium]